MQNSLERTLAERLAERRSAGTLRQLIDRRESTGLVDFSSNDYLGFARSKEFSRRFDAACAEYRNAQSRGPANTVADGFYAAPLHGATGSRILSGNSRLACELEQELAKFYRAESALLFNSGYDANLSLVSALATRGDTVLFDELVHASIRDGARLSFARSFHFSHNDAEDLERRLMRAREARTASAGSGGKLLVFVDSIYSMDGDAAPLEALLAVCERYDAALIVDEAHAGGIYGANGRGKVAELGLEDRVFARLHTFGKALGCHGAVVTGSTALCQYLINFARPLMYSTALPALSLLSIKIAHELLAESEAERERLVANVGAFCAAFSALEAPQASGPIQPIVIGGNERTRSIANAIRERGFDVRAILSPTVAPGTERLRLCIHSFNTVDEITGLVAAIAECR